MFPFNHKFSKDDLESLEKEIVKLEAELALPELTDDVRLKVYYCGMNKSIFGRSQEALYSPIL